MVRNQTICTKHTFLSVYNDFLAVSIRTAGNRLPDKLSFVSPTALRWFPPVQTIRLPMAMVKGSCGARHWVIRVAETQQSHLAPGGPGLLPSFPFTWWHRKGPARRKAVRTEQPYRRPGTGRDPKGIKSPVLPNPKETETSNSNCFPRVV